MVPREMSRLLRPLLTLLLTIGLFGTTTYFVLIAIIAGDLYLSLWLNIVSMMIAFYFGERSAMKQSDK